MSETTKKISTKQENTPKDHAVNDNSITPMMQQYIDIKKNNPNYLLFYRMGDFYELFFDDAILAARELDIVLTKRGKNNGEDIPMCGVPHHSYESYLNKLIKKGYKVAICEQTETPEEAKKNRGYKAVVRREVTKIVTQGTLTDEKMLDKGVSNNLVALFKTEEENISISWCDISTGTLLTNEINNENLISELERLSPAEIVICDEMLGDRKYKTFIDNYRNIITTQNKTLFSQSRAKDKIKSFFELSNLSPLGGISEDETRSLGALIEYIEITQINDKPRLDLPRSTKSSDFLEIDAATFRNLEIFRDFEGKTTHSLFGALNNTKTASGSRKLQNLLARPLKDIKEINKRYEGIEFFIDNPEILEKIQKTLSTFPDIERIGSRFFVGKTSPRDFASLRDGLSVALNICDTLTFCDKKLPNILENNSKNLNILENLRNRIDECLVDSPPLNLNEGGFIKNGFNAKLDDYRNTKENAEVLKQDLLEKYKKQTGIQTLKIKENNVIGMFIETNPNNIDKIPANFIHKQTLASAVRYTSDELKEIENKIINADSYSIAIEIEILNELKQLVINEIENIRMISSSIGIIDVISNFANTSKKRGYSKPNLTNKYDFDIKSARHPVVELSFKNTREATNEYVANDTNLNKERIWLLTGPNMSGKSTFLRQNALICIMAQIGCFIPAQKATIGIIDKVFSRVGASDNLSKGQSTFMVEMNETAYIINNATESSFVILDEIGRGTSTFDGLSIAWATLEHIDNNIGCRSIFATHYHELTSLAKNSKFIKNYTMKTDEWDGDIIFRHKIIEGQAGQSYGIHVAKLAGLPKSIIERANSILEILQNTNKGNATEILSENLPLFETKPQPYTNQTEPSQEFKMIQKILLEVDVNNLTPIQALNLLNDLKSKI